MFDRLYQDLGIDPEKGIVGEATDRAGQILEDSITGTAAYKSTINGAKGWLDSIYDAVTRFLSETISPFFTQLINWAGDMVADLLGYPEIPHLSVDATATALSTKLATELGMPQDELLASIQQGSRGFGRLSYSKDGNNTDSALSTALGIAESAVDEDAIRNGLLDPIIRETALAAGHTNLDEEAIAALREQLISNADLARQINNHVGDIRARQLNVIKDATLAAINGTPVDQIQITPAALSSSLPTDAIKGELAGILVGERIAETVNNTLGKAPEILEELQRDNQLQPIVKAIANGTMTEADLQSIANMTPEQRTGFLQLLDKDKRGAIPAGTSVEDQTRIAAGAVLDNLLKADGLKAVRFTEGSVVVEDGSGTTVFSLPTATQPAASPSR